MSAVNLDKIMELTEKLTSDPNTVWDLTEEEVESVRRHMNPYATAVRPENESWINISIINWRDEFMKKFHMMALIGFMYRMLTEYEPEYVREFAEKRAAETGEAFDKVHSAALKRARDAVKMFLDKYLRFDVDKHVRTASVKQTANAPIEVPEPVTNEAQPCPESVKTAYQQLVKSRDEIAELLTSDELSADMRRRLIVTMKQLDSSIADLGVAAVPAAEAEVAPVYTVTPPADVLYHYNRYVTNNYEQLRQAYEALYTEKPDLEYAVIYYDAFQTEAAAAAHREKNTKCFKSEVLTLSNGGVTILGPFKENRAKIDYYNKHTELLKQMMDQVEADHKLGKDLMEKRVRAKKVQNIKECGPDAPGLASYAAIGSLAKNTSSLREMGASAVMTQEEQEAVAEQSVIPAEPGYDINDTIDVGMFLPEYDADGKLKSLKKDVFLSQSEVPLHMQEGSEYTEEYQPKRAIGNVKAALKAKTVVSKTGEKKTIYTTAK